MTWQDIYLWITGRWEYFLIAAMFVALLATALMVVRNHQLSSYENLVRRMWFNSAQCDLPDPTKCELRVRPAAFTLSAPANDNFDKSHGVIMADGVVRIAIPAKTDSHRPTEIIAPTGFTQQATYQVFDSGPWFGVVWTYDADPSQVLVAFRATVGNREIRKDLQYAQKEFLGALFHSGFVDVYNEFRQDLKNTLLKLAPSHVHIGGHSLGAAVATIAHADLTKDGYSVSTYAYGCPRVGNAGVDDLLTGNYWRVSNRLDPFITTPFSVMPDLHDKDVYYLYEDVGNDVQFTENWGSLQANHGMPMYYEFMWDDL